MFFSMLLTHRWDFMISLSCFLCSAGTTYLSVPVLLVEKCTIFWETSNYITLEGLRPFFSQNMEIIDENCERQCCLIFGSSNFVSFSQVLFSNPTRRNKVFPLTISNLQKFHTSSFGIKNKELIKKNEKILIFLHNQFFSVRSKNKNADQIWIRNYQRWSALKDQFFRTVKSAFFSDSEGQSQLFFNFFSKYFK